MKVQISTNCFNKKPTSKEISQLTFEFKEIDTNDFSIYLSKGYCFCNVYSDGTITINEKNKSNFKYSNLVSVDIDHSSIPMNDALSRIVTTPSIAYETYSNGTNGEFSYRFVYVLKEDCDNNSIQDAINYFYDKVENELNVKTDKRARNPYQYFNGTYNKNIVTNDIEYSILSVSKQQISHYLPMGGIVAHKDKNKGLNQGFSDNPIIGDFYHLPYGEFVSKYIGKFRNIEQTPIGDISDDEPLIYFPNNHREIKRKFRIIEKDGHKETIVRRLKDGEKRRYHLVLNGILRRLIEPSLTLEDMLYDLSYEMYHYIDNLNKTITKRDIFEIAMRVMKCDLKQYESLGLSKRKYIANPKYCLKYNMTRRKVVDKFKGIDYDAVGDMYDCSMNDRDNVETMKQYGITISIQSLRKWIKKQSIFKEPRTKHIDYSIVDEILKLNLSVRKTIAECEKKGAHISIGALQKYKKSLTYTKAA